MGIYPALDGGFGIDANIITEVSTTYTVTSLDDIVIADGTFTVTLPPVATALKAVIVKSALGGGTITVEGDAAETIDGELNQEVVVGDALIFSPTSIGWVVIGRLIENFLLDPFPDPENLDTVTVDTDGVSGDYANLKAALDALEGDLVTATRSKLILCQATTFVPDTTVIGTLGATWVTDANNRLIIRQAAHQRHPGLIHPHFYTLTERMTIAAGGPTNVEFDGLQWDHDGTGSSAFHVSNGTYDLVFRNLVMDANNETNAISLGTLVLTGSKAYFLNNVISDIWTSGGAAIVIADLDWEAWVANNMFDVQGGNNHAVNLTAAATCHLNNNNCKGATTTPYKGTFAAGSNNNLSDQGLHPVEDLSDYVALWRFEEAADTTAIDESANGHDLTDVGTVGRGVGNFVNQPDNQSAICDSPTNSYFSLASHVDFNSYDGAVVRSWTMGAFVKIPIFGAVHAIAQKANSGSPRDFFWRVEASGVLRLLQYNGNGSTTLLSFTGTDLLPAGEFVYCIGGLDVSGGAASAKLFLKVGDNALEESGTFDASSLLANTSTLRIGGDEISGNELTGELDNVVRYNRLLSTQEMADLQTLNPVSKNDAVVQFSEDNSATERDYRLEPFDEDALDRALSNEFLPSEIQFNSDITGAIRVAPWDIGPFERPVEANSLDDFNNFWRMGEAASQMAIDQSFNALHLEDNNTVATNAAGVVGNCRDLERGTIEYFDAPNAQIGNLNPGNNSFFGSIWAKTESNPGGFDSATYLGVSDASDMAWRVVHSGLSGSINFQASVDGTTILQSTVTAPAIGVWHHLFFEYDSVANTVLLQINNVARVASAGPTGIHASAADFRIGISNALTAANAYDGLIDLVGFWHGRISTEDERTALYSGLYNGTDRGDIQRYDLLSTPLLLQDASVNNYDLSNFNGAAYNATEKAAEFDGVNEALYRADNADYRNGDRDYTHVVRVKFNNVAHDGCLFSKYATAPNREVELALTSAGKLELRVDNGGASGITTESLVAGVWYTMIYSYNAATKLHKVETDNGDFEEITFTHTNTISSTAGFLLGATNYGPGAEFLDGYLGMYRRFNRLITAAEKSVFFNLNATGRGLSDFVTWHDCNEASGNRSDQSANNHVMVDTNTVTSAPGIRGLAAEFLVANSEKLTVAAHADFRTPAVSIAGWFKLTGGGPSPGVMFDHFGATGGWRLQSNGTDFLWGTRDGGTFNNETIFTPWVADTWYFFACTADATEKKYSVNGAALTTVAHSGFTNTLANALEINSAVDYTDMHASQVALWNRVITQAEVDFLYNNGIGRSYPF